MTVIHIIGIKVRMSHDNYSCTHDDTKIPYNSHNHTHWHQVNQLCHFEKLCFIFHSRVYPWNLGNVTIPPLKFNYLTTTEYARYNMMITESHNASYHYLCIYTTLTYIQEVQLDAKGPHGFLPVQMPVFSSLDYTCFKQGCLVTANHFSYLFSRTEKSGYSPFRFNTANRNKDPAFLCMLTIGFNMHHKTPIKHTLIYRKRHSPPG